MMTTQEERQEMVDRQIASRGVRDARLLEAMRTIPREAFVPENLREFAYGDAPLPIEEGQTISQPFVVALMIEALELAAEDRVLEVGAGSGYAAAVLGQVAREVYAIERHPTLAQQAAERVNALGYADVHIVQGDGSEGWPEQAPFDAIVVAAGGPKVPESLEQQLALGGRLVIPVGTNPRAQELIRVRRTGRDAFEHEPLGGVSFVPLIGSEGWTHDGVPAERRQAARPLRPRPATPPDLPELIANRCEPIDSIADCTLDDLLTRVGEARVVLIGEASHGTSEFYRMRARITQELIAHRGFNAVAIEGDWPDVSTLDRYVRDRRPLSLNEPPFSRFPTWMWRNREVQDFVDWLRSHNQSVAKQHSAVSMHGLDLYSLYNSISAVLQYLEEVNPEAAQAARVRYGCFSPWETDPAVYGRAAVRGRVRACRNDTVAVLRRLLEERLQYVQQDGDAFFDAERNAALIRDAEEYYRVMYEGPVASWNLRDRHMFDTLQAVLEHRGPGSKTVVWAHNSHLGNAAATEMGARGELNVGQLAREAYGQDAYLIGFGTNSGTVAAGSDWDGPMEVKDVRPAHQNSYERLCHQAQVARFLLPLRAAGDDELRERLLEPRLERAIGVIYRPETELASHYFQAALPAQFDEYIWFDETTAVTPLEAAKVADTPETYPFGI